MERPKTTKTKEWHTYKCNRHLLVFQHPTNLKKI
jgi:hypothetical protein